MKVRLIPLLAAFLLALGPVSYGRTGDDCPFMFKTTTHDFGTISETGGPVSFAFSFVNVSKEDVLLASVVPSCSCVSVEYNRAVIKPGESSQVTVSYDPASLPGQFHQNVLVLTGDNRARRLYIEGFVKEREKGRDELYPYFVSEGLQVSSLKLRYGFCVRGTVTQKRVGIVNTSNSAVSLSYKLGEASEWLKASGPSSLGPQQTGEIIVEFCPRESETGTLMNSLSIVSSGVEAGKNIRIEGYSVECLGEAPDAPVFRFEPTLLKFKRKGSSQSCRLMNDGCSRLTIVCVECPDGIETDIEKGLTIPAGEHRTVHFRLLKENTNGNVRIFTNDPSRPVRDIVIKKDIK